MNDNPNDILCVAAYVGECFAVWHSCGAWRVATRKRHTPADSFGPASYYAWEWADKDKLSKGRKAKLLRIQSEWGALA